MFYPDKSAQLSEKMVNIHDKKEPNQPHFLRMSLMGFDMDIEKGRKTSWLLIMRKEGLALRTSLRLRSFSLPRYQKKLELQKPST